MDKDESDTTPVWAIHAGRKGEADSLFLNEGYITIGWEQLADLSTIPPSDTVLRERLEAAYPSLSPGVLTRHAGEIYRFAHEINVGDLIVYSSKRDKQIYLGRVTGPYEYRPDFSPFPYVRKVEWHRILPRTDLPKAMSEVDRRMTVIRVTQHADEVRAAFVGERNFHLSRRYWAYLAKPNLYRVEDAIRAKWIDLWPTKGRDVRAGDRVLIWQALGGRGTRRGIIAFGEVMTNPKMLDDSDNPFWMEKVAVGAELRVQVRYVHAPDLPLWYGDGATLILAQLSVSRGQGTIFNITPEQWQAVVEAAGGWLEDDAPPEVLDARDTASVFAGRRHSGQGFLISAEQRKAIESHAVQLAIAHYEVQGWKVEDVGLHESYDLRCTRDDEEMHVEVKGTTSAGATILLTRNEVKHVQKVFPRVALFIVANIIVSSDDGRVQASGGKVIIHEPWMPDNRHLTPIQYEYAVPLGNKDNGS